MTIRDQLIVIDSLRIGQILPPRWSWVNGRGQRVLQVQTSPANNAKAVQLEDLDVPVDHPERIRWSGPHRFESHRDGVARMPVPSWRHETPEDLQPVRDNLTQSVRTGSVDWSKSERQPIADEIQRHDRLPRRYEDLEWAGEQEVRRVQYDSYLGKLRIHVSDLNSAVCFTFYPQEKVEFPLPASAREHGRHGGASREGLDAIERAIRDAEISKPENLETIGFFRHVGSGAVFRFVKHPRGRGPWPKNIPPYDPNLMTADGAPIISQPPRGWAAGESPWVHLERVADPSADPGTQEPADAGNPA